MQSLSEWFESLFFGENRCKVVTVIGSGGKTSLIWHLAVGFGRVASFVAKSNRKILVTPTTKMLVPEAGEKLYDRYINGVPPEPAPGITLTGIFNEASGKLESLPLSELEKIIPAYDLVLIEGDGSKGLPLKAWAEYEPVVPPFTDLTIGMLPLGFLGKPVTEKLVHRLPLFLELSGAAPVESLKPEHIVRLISGGTAGSGASPLPGLFAKARGKKLLFLNQVEDDDTLTQARKLAGLLPPRFREELCGIIAGSVKENKVTVLLKRR